MGTIIQSPLLPGYFEERWYDPAIVSHQFAVGECIEWVEGLSDSEYGPLEIFECGVIQAITRWMVRLEIAPGTRRRHETSLYKHYLEEQVTNPAVKAAIQASREAEERAEQERSRRQSSALEMKLCFLCMQFVARQAFQRHRLTRDTGLILTEVCEPCYRRTKNKIDEYNREARKHGGQASLKVSEWLEKLRDTQGHCSYCQKDVGLTELVIEHVIPLSRGGDNTAENVVPACAACNSLKGVKDSHTWQRDLKLHVLLEQLQKHLQMEKADVIELAVRRFAFQEGLITKKVIQHTKEE
jgi:5-methylcytosine-specific restriction endonuclease McrA